MRRILFVHNGPLFQAHDGRNYGVMMNNSLKERYLALGDHVTFLMRKRIIDPSEEHRYSLINDTNFSFIEIPEVMTFTTLIRNLRVADKIVRRAVASHDLVVVRLPSVAGNLAIRHCKQLQKPFMVEMVACSFDALWYYNWKGKILAPIMYLLQKRRMKRMPYVIYVTKLFLQSRYPSKGIQTNISDVELEAPSQQHLDERLKKINSWDGHRRLVLGTVAAIDVPYKCQADVIMAVAILKSQNIHLDYHLAGEGSAERLISLIKRLGLEDHVKILGAVQHSEVFGFLQDIDIYVQPSRQEGLPRAVIEAMSMACPVLGAATGGIPELIRQERIFRKGRIREIAMLIKSLSNKDEMQSDAIRNFNEAKYYDRKLLEERRRQFYQAFLVDSNMTDVHPDCEIND